MGSEQQARPTPSESLWVPGRRLQIIEGRIVVRDQETAMGKVYPTVSEDYKKVVEKAKRKIRALISVKQCAPLMLRLAWHSVGTFDVKTKTGGPFGTMRHASEQAHGANKGLEIAYISLLFIGVLIVIYVRGFLTNLMKAVTMNSNVIQAVVGIGIRENQRPQDGRTHGIIIGEGESGVVMNQEDINASGDGRPCSPAKATNIARTRAKKTQLIGSSPSSGPGPIRAVMEVTEQMDMSNCFLNNLIDLNSPAKEK
ncbi:hypothetical protein Syun_013758 [Stephania yunnanensis]|uniref:Uncharacterized protein n=1 Tax=Stephania yunnanensis TaxID=152371 RepID=A0AAP0JHZ2_9MAGN